MRWAALRRGRLDVAEFHEYCARMQAEHPITMTTLATHDTKRSDDVRARLAALTEIPARWKSAVNRWSRRNARFRSQGWPDRNTEYLLYQTLIGAWPISQEIGLRLTWRRPCARPRSRQAGLSRIKEFEDALQQFIYQILHAPDFLRSSRRLCRACIVPGRINSLAQTLLQIHGARECPTLTKAANLGSPPRRSRQPQSGGLRGTALLLDRTAKQD